MKGNKAITARIAKRFRLFNWLDERQAHLQFIEGVINSMRRLLVVLSATGFLLAASALGVAAKADTATSGTASCANTSVSDESTVAQEGNAGTELESTANETLADANGANGDDVEMGAQAESINGEGADNQATDECTHGDNGTSANGAKSSLKSEGSGVDQKGDK